MVMRRGCVVVVLALLLSTTAIARSAKVKAADKQANPPPPRVVTTSDALPVRAADAMHAILNEPTLNGAKVGVYVWDVAADRALVETGADELINPASNAKLVTAAAALTLLGPDYRWKTEYYVAGRIADGVLFGDLIVKGYGDPTVVSERIHAVASELWLLGIHKITGSVVVDDTHFDRVLEAKGWEMEDAPDRAYAAPVSGLSLNYNAIGVNIRPATARGAPAVVEVEPPVEYATLEGTIGTAKWSRRLGVGTKPDRFTTKIVVEGEISNRERARRFYRRVYDPPRYFGSTLVKFMQQRGVNVKHRVVPGTVPAGAHLVHIDESPPLSRVVNDLNHYSNNFIAETIVKTIGAERRGAPGTFTAGLREMQTFLVNDIGFTEGTFVVENGSGLNDVNRLTARQVVLLLDVMNDRYDVSPEFIASLAVAGTQGTIRNRMRDGPAERRSRAKTGTLRGVSALSGYVVDPRNRLMAYSILVEGYAGDVRVSQIWEIQDKVVEALASDGESHAPPAAPSSDAVALVVTPEPARSAP